jgi:hypothetical protein
MRHGKIGWYTAIVLAGMASVTSTRAAAPPAKEVEMSDTEVRTWLFGDSCPEQVKVPATRQQRERSKAVAACLPEQSGSGDFSGSTVREITIVVRIKEGICEPGEALPSRAYRRRVALPSQQVVRQPRPAGTFWCPGAYIGSPVFEFDSDPSPWVRGNEVGAVLATLKDKFLELHEEGWFEVTFEPQGDDRAEVNINYEPVCPPPPEPDVFGGFGIGFSR